MTWVCQWGRVNASATSDAARARVQIQVDPRAAGIHDSLYRTDPPAPCKTLLVASHCTVTLHDGQLLSPSIAAACALWSATCCVLCQDRARASSLCDMCFDDSVALCSVGSSGTEGAVLAELP